MSVDSFKFLPRLIATFYQMTDAPTQRPIPWTPLTKPLKNCKFGLVTSAGLYQKGAAKPFDLTREKAEPLWGDPSYRPIPSDSKQETIGVSHLHINTSAIEKDVNIVLPLNRFGELVAQGKIGAINVPVLARTLEAAGLATILVTMMPYWAEKIGVPRTLAVEFPFGHSLGQPFAVAQQMRVIKQALDVLATAVSPGTIIHSEEKWPQDQAKAYKMWQPAEPSPVIAELAPKFRQMLRENHKKRT